MIPNVFHPGAMGDMIYAIPAFNAIGQCNVYTKAANHPRRIRTRQIIHNFMKRILEAQPVIQEFGYLPDDIKIDYNFNNYRKIANIKKDQHLAQTQLETFKLKGDISKPWLKNIEAKQMPQRIILHYTRRYHDYATEKELQYQPIEKYPEYRKLILKNNFDYNTLKDFQKEILILGKRIEWIFVQDMFNIKCEYIEPKDAYEFAQIIKGSKLLIGNQSIGLALAESLKKPRAYEYFSEYDNCKPNSDNGHRFLNKQLIEHYLNSEKNYGQA